MAEQKTSAISILQDSHTGACWSCGDMRAAHFCDSCGKVQPAAPTDYFSFFGLSKKLHVDTAQLEHDYYALNRKLHPDLYARMSGEEKNWSLEKTSQLNDAYRTLKDPIARTEYLLKLEGVNFEEQSKSATEQARTSGEVKKQAVPPDMLEEVFELNMQLEEARMNKKMGETDESLARDLEQTKNHLQQKFDGYFEELRGYWDEWDALADVEQAGHSVDPAQRKSVLNKLIDLLNRRSYIRNLVRDVNEVLEG
jgi:molecular chaperone HscB